MRRYQLFLRVIGFGPILASAVTWSIGLSRYSIVDPVNAAVDSDLRFLAGIVAASGAVIVYASFNPAPYTQVLLIIFGGVLVGNLGRGISFAVHGGPGAQPYFFAIFTTFSAAVGFAWTLRLLQGGTLQAANDLRLQDRGSQPRAASDAN